MTQPRRDLAPAAANDLVFDKLPGRGSTGFWLTEADIREFRLLMNQSCGVGMDSAEAWKRATQLVGLVRALLGPHPEDPEGTERPGSSTLVTIAHQPCGQVS